MKVRAKKLVYYNDKRVREGEEFELVPREGYRKLQDEKLEKVKLSAEDQFSAASMEPVDGKAPVKKEEPKVEEPKAEVESAADEDVI